MKRRVRLLCFASLTGTAALCLGQIPTGAKSNIADRSNTNALFAVMASNDFGLRTLALSTRMRGENENVIFCPYSAAQAWSACLIGARGQTYTKLSEALTFTTFPDLDVAVGHRELASKFGHEPCFTSVNSLWLFPPHGQVKPAYQAQVRQSFGSDIVSVSSARTGLDAINQWASTKTGGLIPRLLNQVDNNVVLAIVNASLFKSGWRTPPSLPTNNADLRFTLESGTVIVTKMLRFQQELEYADSPRWSAVVIPYSTPRYVFIAALPEGEANVAGMWAPSGPFQEGFLSRFKKRSVSVLMPAFNASQEWDLLRVVKGFGADDIDTPKADFSGISSGGLWVSQAIQKAVIGVDVTGTQAAAATAVVMTRGMSPRPTSDMIQFKANRPFAYAIVDRHTSAILFGGVCAKP
jgi:serpin B